MSIAFALFALLAAASPAPPADDADAEPNAHTILAEMALERGDCKGAAENYLAAVAQGDKNLVRRASEVGWPASTCLPRGPRCSVGEHSHRMIPTPLRLRRSCI